MLKIRQTRLQQYMNLELPDVQAGFWKDRGRRDCQHSLDHTGSKGIPEGCLLLLHWHTKPFDCVDQNRLKNSWRDGNTRPIYLPPEKPVCRSKATIRTGHGTMGWFQIGKGVHQGCILSPCLFNLYPEYIMWNARLDETQAGIKIARRNINNLRYADDTTLMAESEEKLKSLLMRVKEESEKAGIKANIQKTKIMASEPITSWQINGEKMKTVMDFIFLGSKITADDDCSHKIKRHSLLGRRAVRSISSVAKLYLTLWELVDGGMPGFPVLHRLPEFAQTHVHWVGDAIQPSNPLSSLSLLALNLSSIRVFSNESILHVSWPKDWSFSFSIRFRTDVL